MGIGGAILGAALLASSVASNRAAYKQARAQRDATRQAERQQQQVAEQARADERRQNQNKADVSGILQDNINSALSGGSTLLTGAGGVSNDRLNLGAGNKLG